MIRGISNQSALEFTSQGFGGKRIRLHICPNCLKLFQYTRSFYEIRLDEWILLCSDECIKEFEMNGRREALLL